MTYLIRKSLEVLSGLGIILSGTQQDQQGEKTHQAVWRNSHTGFLCFLPPPGRGQQTASFFQQCNTSSHVLSFCQGSPFETETRMFIEDRPWHSLPATTTKIAGSQKESRCSVPQMGKATLSLRNCFKSQVPRCQPRACLLFFAFLFKAPRKLTMAASSDSFTTEKLSKALGLDKYGCDSHMTFSKSGLLSQPQGSHLYKEIVTPSQGCCEK